MKRLDLTDEVYKLVLQYLGDMVELNDSAHKNMPTEELENGPYIEQNDQIRDLVSSCRGDNGHEAGAMTITIWQKDDEDIELIANVVPYDYDDGMVYYWGRLEVNSNSNEQKTHPMEGRTVNMYLPILDLLGMSKD